MADREKADGLDPKDRRVGRRTMEESNEARRKLPDSGREARARVARGNQDLAHMIRAAAFEGASGSP